MTRDDDHVAGERWARSSPLPHLEGGVEPWPAWKAFGAIVLFCWGCVHAAVDLRAVVGWIWGS